MKKKISLCFTCFRGFFFKLVVEWEGVGESAFGDEVLDSVFFVGVWGGIVGVGC